MSREETTRRWRVYCSQWAQCGWAGYRHGTAESVKAKPCPKRGRAVVR